MTHKIVFQYRYKPVLDQQISESPPNTSRLPANRKLTATISKLCSKCHQSVLHKKHITFEDGEVNCQNCHNITLNNASLNTPRPKSSHMVSYSLENNNHLVYSYNVL